MSPGRADGGAAASYRPHEIAIAAALALLVEAIAVVGLRAAQKPRAPSAAAPSPTEAVIPVRAVGLDDPNAPLLKRGGGAPDARSRAAPAPREPGTPAPEARSAAPPPDTAPEAPPEIDYSKAPPPGQTEAPPANEPEPLRSEEGDARAGGASSEPGSSELGSGEPGPSALPPGPGGEGHPEGSPDGTEVDPLKARAVSLYRARLIAWFSSRFRVSGSGLPQEELARLRASATVMISSDRRVVSFTLSPSGSAPFDAAARAALESSVGSSIPPPPESYPDVMQSSIHVTFVCRRSQCD